MKRVMITVLLIGILTFSPVFMSGAAASDDVILLRICSWEEYIDEGGWDIEELGIHSDNSMIADFENWFFDTYGKKVKVEYSTFGTNEELYSQLTLGDTYDLVCPSDYMIMKLMMENRLLKLSDDFFDKTDENNYYVNGVSPYINDVFESNSINGEAWAEYAAGYMWGITGIVYNPDYVTQEEASTWSILTDKKFYRQVTMKDNVRDAYFPTLAIMNSETLLDENFRNSAEYKEKLMEMMNSTDAESVEKAEEVLKDIRNNVYSFETDSGKSDMVTGKIVANYQWSGDGVYAIDQAQEDGVILNWAVPKECTNLWFDGWVMLKDGIAGDDGKQQAAEAFVNFVSRPDSAVRNMYYIGYTSAIAGGDDMLVYDYADWNFGAQEGDEDVVEYPVGYFFSGDDSDERYIMIVPREQLSRQLSAQYPDSEQIKRSAIMQYYDADANARINQMWINIRCFNLSMISAKQWAVAAAVISACAGMVVVFCLRHRIFKRRIPKGYEKVQ